MVSSWCNAVSLPESYVHPPEKRPGKLTFPVGKSIPVLDLASLDRKETIQKIMKASEEFGFFQVISHGVSKDLMDDTLNVVKEFFQSQPTEDKVNDCSKDPSCRFLTSSEHYKTEQVHYWREALLHYCHDHDLESNMQFWPTKPATYREVVGAYTIEVRKLGSRILELISEGLELDKGYFNSSITDSPTMVNNHYPRCPDPSLTLGLAKHCDPTVITIVLQEDVQGLQVLKDGEWISVEPVPDAFVVNIGYLLQIISNGKLKSIEHRVLNNLKDARTSMSFFIYPSMDCVIEPAKALVNACNPPLYRALTFKDFKTNFMYNMIKSADDEAIREFTSSSS